QPGQIDGGAPTARRGLRVILRRPRSSRPARRPHPARRRRFVTIPGEGSDGGSNHIESLCLRVNIELSVSLSLCDENCLPCGGPPRQGLVLSNRWAKLNSGGFWRPEGVYRWSFPAIPRRGREADRIGRCWPCARMSNPARSRCFWSQAYCFTC